jgi:hypothetical protein
MVGPPIPFCRVQEMWYPWYQTSSNAIASALLAECAHWHRSNSTPIPVRPRTGRVMPSAARLTPSHLHPLLTSHPGPCCGSRAGVSSHRPTFRLARGAQVCSPSAAHGAHSRVSIATFVGRRLRRRVASPANTPLAMRRSCFARPREAGR